MMMKEPPTGNLGGLTTMRKDYVACWKAELGRPNGLTAGNGKIAVTLKPDGTLSDVAVTGFEKSKSLTSCLTEVVKAGQFLPPPEGDPKLAFVLRFRPNDAETASWAAVHQRSVFEPLIMSL